MQKTGTRDPGPAAAGPACLRRVGRGLGWAGLGWGEGRGGVRGAEVWALSHPGTLQARPRSEAAAPLRHLPPTKGFAAQGRVAPGARWGPRSSEPPAGLCAAQPWPRAPILPGTCPVPKAPGSHQRGEPELVSPAPSPYRGPPCPHAALQAQHLPEGADERHAGTRTDTQTLAGTHAT